MQEVDGTLADGSIGTVGCKEMVDFVDCKLSTTSSAAKVVVVGYMRLTIGLTGSCWVGRLKDRWLPSSFYFWSASRNSRVESSSIMEYSWQSVPTHKVNLS